MGCLRRQATESRHFTPKTAPAQLRGAPDKTKGRRLLLVVRPARASFNTVHGRGRGDPDGSHYELHPVPNFCRQRLASVPAIRVRSPELGLRSICDLDFIRVSEVQSLGIVPAAKEAAMTETSPLRGIRYDS